MSLEAAREYGIPPEDAAEMVSDPTTVLCEKCLELFSVQAEEA